ncbi:MAG: reverse transcriptase/maturase family protein [Candidatus Uhrbacteria bacterium]
MPQQITIFDVYNNGQFGGVSPSTQLGTPWVFGGLKSSGGGGAKRGVQQLVHNYDEIISLENLCLAWEEFLVGKKQKNDVQNFELALMDNILSLHADLASGQYQHGGYESFFINDPKRRHIHKASVRDRLLHHAVYRLLYPFFDRTFIADSYSCREEKGTHKAINRFRSFANKVGKNNTRTCWVLKGDIRKFFASIDHSVLKKILAEYISDKKILFLLSNIIDSYETELGSSVGLPLGNLTSQLFSNIYLNRFDQFVKHQLKEGYFIRYADDFVILSDNKEKLINLLPLLENFLGGELKLHLHPDKIFLKTISSGVDFLGWTLFSDYRTIRAVTKQRMFRRIQDNSSPASLQSYLGLLSHGNTYKIRQKLLNDYWLWGDEMIDSNYTN